MPKNVTVGTEVFEIPVQGENPDWGEEVTDWIEAISAEVANFSGPYDISNTTFTLANDQSSAASINGFAFSTSFVRAFQAEYFIERDTDSITKLTESGILYGNYNSEDGSWGLALETIGDAGVTFSITSAGQIQYTSTNLSGSSYVGQIKFSATTTQA